MYPVSSSAIARRASPDLILQRNPTPFEMIYPIGHTTIASPFTLEGNTLRAGGIAVTDDSGWISVPMPADAVASGAPAAVSIQLRADRITNGRCFFIAAAIEIAGERYEALFELLRSPHRVWLPALGLAIDAEIARRITDAQRARNSVPFASRIDAIAAPPAREGVRERRPILIVDGDREVWRAFDEVLGSAGHTTVAALDGAAALEYLRNNPPPALILLELWLPGMDGWAFLDERRRDPELASIPVVVVTGHGGATRVAPYVGVEALLAKPVSPEELLVTVERYRARGQARRRQTG